MLGISILLCGCHDWSTQSCEQQGQIVFITTTPTKLYYKQTQRACRQMPQFSNLSSNACRVATKLLLKFTVYKTVPHKRMRSVAHNFLHNIRYEHLSITKQHLHLKKMLTVCICAEVVINTLRLSTWIGLLIRNHSTVYYGLVVVQPKCRNDPKTRLRIQHLHSNFLTEKYLVTSLKALEAVYIFCPQYGSMTVRENK